MVKYETKEIVVVENRVRYCLYCFLKTIESIRKIDAEFKKGFKPDPKLDKGFEVQFHFYRENFHIQLSELYSFFYLKKDEEILSQLELTDEQRKIHREVRHGYAHFERFSDALSLGKELMKKTGRFAETKDMLKIIKYSKKLLNEPESNVLYKNDVNKRLAEVLGLFPTDFITQDFIGQVLE
jgi:hypothetical protein